MSEVLTSHIFPFMNNPICQLFMDTAAEGILVIDRRGHIITANTKVHEMFGFKDEVLQGKLFSTLIPHENVWDFENRLKEAADKEHVNRIKVPVLNGKKNSGEEFPIKLSLSLIQDEEDYLLGFIVDQSSLKDFKDQFARNKLDRQYFDVAEVILLVLDLKGDIVDINKQGCQLLGYTRDELVGKNWFNIVPTEVEDIQTVFEGVLKEETEHQTHDNFVLTKENEKRLIHWQNTVIRNENGEIIGSLSSGTDITERHEMLNALRENEEKLKAYNTDLEKEVHTRTKELEELLNQERNLSEMKSKFVSLASHEFRTPLSTILSSASLISKYPDGDMQEKRVKHVSRIKSAVAHLNGILEDFLSIDRLNEGKVVCEPEQFDINDVFEEVKQTLSGILKSGQILTYVVSGSQRYLITDRKLVRNILVNLTSNAIKYSPVDKPIRMKCDFESENVICEISDEGIGIPEEDQKHLFERFFRAHNTRNFQGTGLGLSIVKRYVDLLDGDISFLSTPNQGTTFRVRLPIQWKK